jgi:hypothetical protein
VSKNANSFFTFDENHIDLDVSEIAAIQSLMRLAKKWPAETLILFGGAGNSISVRKRAADGNYFAGREVACIGIPSDGGDGGDMS